MIMDKKFTGSTKVEINATAEKVWDALINPDQIKKYLFGTNANSDWTEGSEITYSGEWEGKSYTDKGKILKMETNKRFYTTYWSAASGVEDSPENYDEVNYDLEEKDGKTILTLTQSNNRSQESIDHSMKNWEMVLGEMKKLLEN